jgi:hypothetical protein
MVKLRLNKRKRERAKKRDDASTVVVCIYNKVNFDRCFVDGLLRTDRDEQVARAQ